MLALNTVVDGGRFHILDILGKGGSGVAYLAFDLHRSTSNTAKYYAIKCLLRKSDQSDLLREVQLHKCVSKHKNIVTLRRCVPEGQFQILIMDYCADGDLFRLIIQQHRYFGNDELIKDVFLQIIDAVAYCHSRGIYHRDLKPENILCSHDGTKVYLTDFGLATQEPISHDVGIGSGYYMSPECNAGPKYDSAMNDVWSLGVILMNLCYGRNPWARADLLDETFRAFLSDPNYLASILPIPPAVNSILKGLFALNPGCRMTLDQLRTAILKVDHFIMSPDELRLAKPEARRVAATIQELISARTLNRRETASRDVEAPNTAPVQTSHASIDAVVTLSESIVTRRALKPVVPIVVARPSTSPTSRATDDSSSSLSSNPETPPPSTPNSNVSRPPFRLGALWTKSSSALNRIKVPLDSSRLSPLKNSANLTASVPRPKEQHPPSSPYSSQHSRSRKGGIAALTLNPLRSSRSQQTLRREHTPWVRERTPSLPGSVHTGISIDPDTFTLMPNTPSIMSSAELATRTHGHPLSYQNNPTAAATPSFGSKNNLCSYGSTIISDEGRLISPRVRTMEQANGASLHSLNVYLHELEPSAGSFVLYDRDGEAVESFEALESSSPGTVTWKTARIHAEQLIAQGDTMRERENDPKPRLVFPSGTGADGGYLSARRLVPAARFAWFHKDRPVA